MEWKEACVELGLTENEMYADEILIRYSITRAPTDRRSGIMG
jgi:hypothetical protein